MRSSMKIILGLALTAILSLPAFALPKGQKVEFKGSEKGLVTFDGTAHNAKLKCADCHPGIFAMKKPAEPYHFKHEDMDKGKFCGACHNGKKAFSTAEKENCEKCHKVASADKK